MRLLYTILLTLIAPIAFAWLAVRSRRQTGAPDAWRERLGRLPATFERAPIWIHAASLGEAQAAQSLIEALLERDPAQPLLITTFSATARRHCRQRFGKRATVVALPYDLPLFVNRFLRNARPRLAIFVETEIWPNLYRALARRRVPIVIVSGRLSPRAFKRYRRFFGGLVASCLKQTAQIAAQTRADADRFIALGAPAARVSVIGNLKFDTQPPKDAVTRGAALRRELFGERPVWVAGSTREGEESIVLSAFQRVRERVSGCALVIAPRHPERASAVAELAAAADMEAAMRSNLRDGRCDAPVLIVDAVGELMDFYAAADVAFVGGTLVDVGGHNILEPTVLGRPVVTGPHLDNWHDLASEMVSRGGLTVVNETPELAEAVSRLLSDTEARARAGTAARTCVEASRGATKRALRLLENVQNGSA